MNTSIKNYTQHSDQLLMDIKAGKIKIPRFQRDFVWDLHKSSNLVDSILKNYPIGAFIFWKTKEHLRHIKNLGTFNFTNYDDKDYSKLVLDGQQRITTLFASFEGIKVEKQDFSKIYVDLKGNEENRICLVIEDKPTSFERFLPLKILASRDLLMYISKYPQEIQSKIYHYSNILHSYQFQITEIEEASIDIATDIFTRLNVGGKPLTVFEIMTARTYDEQRSFDLASEYEKLIERLYEVDYETIPNSTLLHSVAAAIKKDVTKKSVFKIDKNEFIDHYHPVINSMAFAIDYLKDQFYVEVSELLPYDALIVVFTYFFYKNNNQKPSGIVKNLLTDYFWRSVINERFSNSMEQVINSDLLKIDEILLSKQPKYEKGISLTLNDFKLSGVFRATKAYIKGILCLFAESKPLSFEDGSKITINNNFLKKQNSKNYHHFFPKAFLSKKGFDEDYANHIANITIVDDRLNKKIIRAKAPSEYITNLITFNKELPEILKHHLIYDINDFGIIEDNYELFFDKRSKAILKKLSEKIIKTDYDNLSF